MSESRKIRTRPLGPNAPRVSVVSYGAWPLSDSSPRPEEPEAIRVIHAALDGGATLIDTADAYCCLLYTSPSPRDL